jgi:hypothetical protein
MTSLVIARSRAAATKQSRQRARPLDCFVASLLAMTRYHDSQRLRRL